MMKFHVNGNGDAGVCRAQNGGCPFGGEESHFDSVGAARQAFEESMEAQKTPIAKLTKKVRKVFGAPDRPEPVFHPTDDFSKMVFAVEAASKASELDRSLDTVEYEFYRDKAINGESNAVPEAFKQYYTHSELKYSDLTLANWTPQSNTQKFIVHKLVENAHSMHDQALQNSDIRKDHRFEALKQELHGGESVTAGPTNADGTISEYDQGRIYGFLQTAKIAMETDFPRAETYQEQMAQLRLFVEREGSRRNSVVNQDDDFEAGTVESQMEWVDEEFDWRVKPNTPVYN